MDFKWKWSALYINLYIEIALHFKISGQWFWLLKRRRWITCRKLYGWIFIVFKWGPILTESGTLCITLSFLSFPFSPSFSFSHSGFINRWIRLLWNIFHIWRMFIKHELVVKEHETMHKCWGSGKWGFYGLLRSGWSIAGVFGIQCFFIYIFVGGWGGVGRSPDSDWPSATSPCCVFLKTNERLTL